MAVETLRAMALGGMRDHVGGGFHRYSVDAEWRVPHFEKMLYDQAQLVLAYLEAAQATGDAFYASVAEDTLEYVLRDMTGPHGGVLFRGGRRQRAAGTSRIHTAHKTEGAFYIWSEGEIQALLGADAAVANAGSGSSQAGMLRTIPRESSPARTSSTRRRPSKRLRSAGIRPPKR